MERSAFLAALMLLYPGSEGCAPLHPHRTVSGATGPGLEEVAPVCAHPGHDRALEADCREAADLLQQEPRVATERFLAEWDDRLRSRKHPVDLSGASVADPVGEVLWAGAVFVVSAPKLVLDSLAERQRKHRLSLIGQALVPALMEVYRTHPDDEVSQRLGPIIGGADFESRYDLEEALQACHQAP